MVKSPAASPILTLPPRKLTSINATCYNHVVENVLPKDELALVRLLYLVLHTTAVAMVDKTKKSEARDTPPRVRVKLSSENKPLLFSSKLSSAAAAIKLSSSLSKLLPLKSWSSLSCRWTFCCWRPERTTPSDADGNWPKK